MDNLFLLLPGLGCAGAMVFCMWMMSRGHGDTGSDSTQAAPDEQITELRSEVERLRSELRERDPGVTPDR